MYGILILGAGPGGASPVATLNFAAAESQARFVVGGPGNLFADVADEDQRPDISEARQYVNTILIEGLFVTINAGFGLATLIAGIYEIKELSFICGGWMLLFALVEIAVISSYQSIRCPTDADELAALDPDNPGCTLLVPDIFVGSQVIFSAIVIFYLAMGVATLLFAKDCDGSAKPSWPQNNGQQQTTDKV